jgi:histone-lysine N-methyltransferase SETMAR
LHDNAPAQWALETQKKMAYLGFQWLDHPTYSPDLAPSDYHLFPGLKQTIESTPFFVQCGGHCYCKYLVDGQPPVFFLSGLQTIEQWVKKCNEVRGEYVE